MCRLAAADGIRAIVATPHRGSRKINTSREQVLAGTRQLRKALAEHNINLDLLPGQEIHIREGLIEDIETGQTMSLNDNQTCFLLELPFLAVPSYVYMMIRYLKRTGIQPVMAHPERNLQIQSDLTIMEHLVRDGALVQITAGSLTGHHGEAARQAAIGMLKKKLVHVMASDAHSSSRPPALSEAVAVAEKFVGTAAAREMVTANPEMIIHGENISCERRVTV
jgi:protein-tyrosine phosphatase